MQRDRALDEGRDPEVLTLELGETELPLSTKKEKKAKETLKRERERVRPEPQEGPDAKRLWGWERWVGVGVGWLWANGELVGVSPQTLYNLEHQLVVTRF